MNFVFSTIFSKILKNRFTLIISAIASVLFGLYFSEISQKFSYVGKLYISFLQLSIIPILMTSIILSIRQLASVSGKTVSLQRSFLIFFSLMIAVCVVGITISTYGHFGEKIAEKPEINELFINSGYSNALELTEEDSIEKQEKTVILNFIVDIIPSNIMQALSNGYILQILSFSLLFGMALGKINDESQRIFVTILQSTNVIFQKIISWAVFLLPLGLFFIVSNQIASMSKNIIFAMGYFLMAILLVMLVFIFFITLVIWNRCACSYRQTLAVLKESALISVVTCSSITALPALIHAMEKLKFDRGIVNLLTPLGMTTCRFGTAFYFSAIAAFIAQMCHVPLTVIDLLIIIIGSILASLMAASAGIVNLKFMSFILEPLGIPINLALALFVAIDTLIDPIRTLLTVLLNAAAVVLSSPREEKSNQSSNP